MGAERISIIEIWPNWKDPDLMSFLKLLNINEIEIKIKQYSHKSEAEFNLFDRLASLSLGYKPEKNREETSIYSEKLYSTRLQEVRGHKLYSILEQTPNFTETLNWLKTRREYEYGKDETLIKTIYIIAFAVTRYTEILRGFSSKQDDSSKLKKVIATSKKLLEQINDYYPHANWALQNAIDDMKDGLKYISSHTPIKLTCPA